MAAEAGATGPAAREDSRRLARWDKKKEEHSLDTDVAYVSLHVHETVAEVPREQWSGDGAAERPRPEGTVRLVCVSDTHGRTDTMAPLPEGDVLVHAGDFSNVGGRRDIEGFVAWLKAQPHKHKVVIAGNHDVTFHREYYEDRGAKRFHRKRDDCDAVKAILTEADVPGLVYLEDSGAVVAGLRFWGSPWQPEFCDWAFNLERGEPCREKWRLIEPCDVLVTHGPALGHGDQCSDGARAGCVDLLETIQTRVRPAVHVAGHIHEGYGVTTDGATTYINASTCTLRYRPTNPAVVWDVAVRSEAGGDATGGGVGGAGGAKSGT